MRMFATGLLPALCLENRETYIQRFSVISVIDSQTVFDIVTKPGAATGIDDKHCAIDLAITRECLRQMVVTY